ncbi:unnamed protein product, partial [Tilletia laevis]
PTPAPEPEPETPTGPYAIALYDYAAAEDNELSFVEGQRIVGLSFPSEDWWEGTNEEDGSVGLFPANYTELQE